jgi:enoyl-CoA hydratase
MNVRLPLRGRPFPFYNGKVGHVKGSDLTVEFQHLTLDTSQPVWVLTISRPEVRNAIGLSTWDELDRAIAAAGRADPCRALIITADGKDFIAGGDLKELQQLTTRSGVAGFSRRAKAVLSRLERLPIPTIAAMEGHAVGGGCELALACDLRVAGVSARFSFWEIKNAVTTGWGGGRRLLALLGRSRATELLLTGRTVGSQRALAIGLINEVAPDSQVLAGALALAEEIAAQPPMAVRAMKALIHGVDGLSPTAADDLETELFVRTWLSADHEEAIRSFVERRPPVWKGR